jgi:hypothetical protein
MEISMDFHTEGSIRRYIKKLKIDLPYDPSYLLGSIGV